jgi:choline-sulfatase
MNTVRTPVAGRPKRPNILFIMADQLAGPALPFHNHQIVKTPYLTRLAESGVVFDSAYCNSPLCAPSRASMMTGQLPSRIGAYDNAAAFSSDIPTLAHYLRAMGYRTYLAGKMHLVGPDQLHGFEERLTTDIYPADFGWTPNWERPERRPSWYHNMLSVVQAGVCETSNQLDYDEEVAFHAVRKLFDIARDDDERPFCLLVSFTHPHDPFAITRDYWDRYNHDDIDLPTVPPLPVDQLDLHSRRLRHVCAMDQYEQTGERVTRARHAYYAMISYVDDKVGQLLRALDAAGLRDNTMVLFTSDHGEMLGERGLWYKMNFFEWSARVPLIFHAPGRFAPRRVAAHVSLVDLLPTLVELALAQDDDGPGPDPIPAVDGQSLVPLLQGDETDWPNPVLAEMLAEGAVAPCLMIRRDRYKYIFSAPDPEQLYDLVADPNELVNLAGQPEFEEVRKAFKAEIRSRWDPQMLRQRVIESQRRRHLVTKALMTGHRQTSWDFQPYQDASQRYVRNRVNLDDLERTARFPSPPVPAPDFPPERTDGVSFSDQDHIEK